MLKPLLEVHDRVAVVCHDAGAANVVFAWIEADMLPRLSVVADGPARAVWERQFPGAALSRDPDAAVSTCAAVVTGSGWASDLELRALRRARALERPSAAVVDHWVNYRARFLRNGVLTLPDEIWVTDADALSLARREVPEVPAVLKSDLHLAKQLRRIRPIGEVVGDKLLYVAEPIRVDWGTRSAGEFAALDFFAERFAGLGLPPNATVLLRPHPSEPPGKYSDWIAGHRRLPVELDLRAEVADSLSEARWAAGCESSVLALALKAGRTVFCTLPPQAPPCRLPQAGLVHLRELSSGAGHG